MKKTFLIVAFVLSATPFLVFADTGPNVRCYDKKFTQEEINKMQDGEAAFRQADDKIRGTCKEIDVTSIVSIDPILQNDYLLAEHAAIVYVCESDSCDITTKSEIINFATSTNLTFLRENIGGKKSDGYYINNSQELKKYIYNGKATLLDKKYVLNYITNVNKKIKSGDLPVIIILDKSEIEKLSNVYDKDPKNNYETYVRSELYNISRTNQEYVYKEKTTETNSQPIIYILNYSDFGKHIYSTNGELKEYNYVDLDKNNQPNIDIDFLPSQKYIPNDKFTVPPTSPLSSVTNYWMYTKKDGKLVLQWQKSEYGLDNGKVKTITKNDKNVSAAMLLSDTTTTTVAPTSSPSETISTSTETIKNVGFISKLITMILSWFK